MRSHGNSALVYFALEENVVSAHWKMSPILSFHRETQEHTLFPIFYNNISKINLFLLCCPCFSSLFWSLRHRIFRHRLPFNLLIPGKKINKQTNMREEQQVSFLSLVFYKNINAYIYNNNISNFPTVRYPVPCKFCLLLMQRSCVRPPWSPSLEVWKQD